MWLAQCVNTESLEALLLDDKFHQFPTQEWCAGREVPEAVVLVVVIIII